MIKILKIKILEKLKIKIFEKLKIERIVNKITQKYI